MTNTNTEMKIPGLNNFKSIASTSTDLKDKVNELQREKRQLRLTMNAKQEQINMLLVEVEKQLFKEEKNK